MGTVNASGWHDITRNRKDLPQPGKRVLICMGHSLNAFVGEGYLKEDGKWYRYCDFEPLERYMSVKVAGWMEMPPPMGAEHVSHHREAAQNAQEPGENTESP